MKTITRDSKHLNFIRQLPCCYCLRGGSQAAHIRKGTDGGMGIKPSDRFTVPLCFSCHHVQHQKGEITFWGDINKPIGLSEALFNMTGNKEKAIHEIIRWNRVFRNQK